MKTIKTILLSAKRTLGVLTAGVCLMVAVSANAAEPLGVPHSLVGRLDLTARDGGDLSGGDLDGDHLADLVSTARNRSTRRDRHTLEIQFSSGAEKQTFYFRARNGGLAIVARDVDGDLDLDLVITARLTGEGVGILINDGTGVFTEGDLRGRQPWVWGYGMQLVTGSSAGPSPAINAASSGDVSVPERDTSLALPCFPVYRKMAEANGVASERGAFYIRPPPVGI